MNEKAKEEAKAQKIDSSLYDGCVDDSEKGYSIANGVVMKVVETKDVKVKKEKKPRKSTRSTNPICSSRSICSCTC